MLNQLNADNVLIDDLPGVLRDMADIVGLQATLAIVRHYGGVRLYVPGTMTPEHPLAQLIGIDAAMRTVRNAEIAEKYRSGKSLRQLSLEYAMTERGIAKALAGMGVSKIRDNRQVLPVRH